MTTTDPRAWLAEVQERAEYATSPDAYVMHMQDVILDDLPAMAAALTAVLDKLEGVTGHPDCSPSECPAKLLANLIGHTITTVLGGDRG